MSKERRERVLGPNGLPYPDEPTPHMPGSPEKIEVMAERYRRRQELFHPDDALPGHDEEED
jgi:hypothetical protein